jgi:hypothetical protein
MVMHGSVLRHVSLRRHRHPQLGIKKKNGQQITLTVFIVTEAGSICLSAASD